MLKKNERIVEERIVERSTCFGYCIIIPIQLKIQQTSMWLIRLIDGIHSVLLIWHAKKRKKIFFKDLIKKQFWRPTQKQDTAFQSSKRKAPLTNKLCLILIRKNILFFCHSIKRWWQRCQHYFQLKPICLPPPLIRKECMQQQNFNQNRNLWQKKKSCLYLHI